MALPAEQPNIDTCSQCGKLFPRMVMPLCTQCSLVDENRFQVVREFLIENNGAAVGDIARGTGVSAADVRKFMDGGRLIEITSGLNECSCSGVGARCKYCRSRLSSSFRDLESTMSREHAERGGRDRFDPSRTGQGKSTDEHHGRTSYVRRIRRIGDGE